MTFTWLNTPAAPINQDVLHAARARQDTLTKPPGALGRLEDARMTRIQVIFSRRQPGRHGKRPPHQHLAASVGVNK